MRMNRKIVRLLCLIVVKCLIISSKFLFEFDAVSLQSSFTVCMCGFMYCCQYKSVLSVCLCVSVVFN